MEETAEITEEVQATPQDTLVQIMQVDNVADVLDEIELARIGGDVVHDHKIDRDSMSDWLERMDRGVELASMVKKDKDYPWKNASNVKYPLVTTAALQFNARAYPAIVSSDGIVRVKTFGKDPKGTKAALAERVGEYMSWQLMSEIEEWEEETDKLLVQLPIVGQMFRKVWYDPSMGRVRCRLVDPGKLIVNDKIKSLSEAPRISEELSLYPDEIESRKRSGFYRDWDYQQAEGEDSSAPEDFIEQHCRIDIDGDGYEEPYIVTVHKNTQYVARIAADFEADDVLMGDGGIIRINRSTYFIPYQFLPSMDGGFFGVGFGLLLGDISETINTIINLQIDAGHMSALGGGFIGSDFRIKGGNARMRPGEWKRTISKGMDIKSSIVPLTFPQADSTLFQLLGLLIDAGKNVASINDVMTGDSGGQTQTATTTLALIEQGMAVFSATYKRVFRSLKKEYKLLAKINADTVDAQKYNSFHDLTDEQGQPILLDPRLEFSMTGLDMEPVADPRSVTKMQQLAKAQIVMQMVEQGLLDRTEGVTRILEAADIPDIEELQPKPDPMQQQAGQMAMQLQQAELAVQMVKVDQALADVEKTRSETMKNLTDASAKEAGIRLDVMKQNLEMIRDGISKTIGQGIGGMAGQPGSGLGPQMPARQPGPPATGGISGLLGGQANAGVGAVGAPQGGRNIGGLV